MKEDRPAPDHVLSDLREVTQHLPPANDMESGPPSDPPVSKMPTPDLQRLKVTLVRVRWPFLAVLVSALLGFGGAWTADTLGRSQIERWGLAMLVMLAAMGFVMLLDVALQWSERAMFDLVQQHESAFMRQTSDQAAQMFPDRQ